jgi:hypothetical protein
MSSSTSTYVGRVLVAVWPRTEWTNRPAGFFRMCDAGPRFCFTIDTIINSYTQYSVLRSKYLYPCLSLANLDSEPGQVRSLVSPPSTTFRSERYEYSVRSTGISLTTDRLESNALLIQSYVVGQASS